MTEEQFLRQQLANLHRRYLEEAQPFIQKLASLEALRPPAPIFVHVDQLPPALREQLRQRLAIVAGVAVEKHEEDTAARIQRLERENAQLRQLLRLVDGIAPGTALPAYLHERVKAVRAETGP